MRVKKCLNCGFVFVSGKVRKALGVRHPNAYYNPASPIPETPYVEEICPKCESDAIKEVEK